MTSKNSELVVAGISFRKTALDIRNKFAFNTEQIRKIYTDKHLSAPEDFFILSTCNRTEIYSTTGDPESLLKLFAYENGIDSAAIKNYSFIKTGDDAIKHLFRVASGLDSQILGDYEIIGQLKNAFALAKTHNKVGGLTEKLVNAALTASREIKNKTNLSDGTTSVSYAAIQLLKELTGEKSLNIVLMGLGKIGTLTLKNLKHYLPQHTISLINRNEEKAANAASEYKVEYLTYDNQSEALNKSDILIVATSADKPLIFKKDIQHTPVKMIFDLSVPSNIGHDVKELNDVKLFNIDELSQLVNQTIEKRKNEVPLAENIINEHFEEFKQWEQRRKQYTAKAGLTVANTSLGTQL